MKGYLFWKLPRTTKTNHLFFARAGGHRRRQSEEQEMEGKLMHLLDLLNTFPFSSYILPEMHQKLSV